MSWESRVIARVTQLEVDLSAGPALHDTAVVLGELARRAGVPSITGASQLGHQLAGAVAVLSDGALTLWSAGRRQDSVLVIEGLLATGAQAMRAAAAAKEAGATRVVIAAVLGERHAMAAMTPEFGDDLTALETVEILVD